ncbi:MAG: hypothetical protein IJR97_02690 [Clostridia bacterium]|nr:hypothetical protein [Clostridia bacterium]
MDILAQKAKIFSDDVDGELKTAYIQRVGVRQDRSGKRRRRPMAGICLSPKNFDDICDAFVVE